jgi:hypothetical protein
VYGKTYDEKIFKMMDKELDEEEDRLEDCVIIETAFNLYAIVRHYEDAVDGDDDDNDNPNEAGIVINTSQPGILI